MNWKLFCFCCKAAKKQKPKPQKWDRRVTYWQKKKTAADQNWRCAHCDELLSAYYEIDHRIPLMFGGSNESVNLMALCRECHAIKTMYEISTRKKKSTLH